MSEFQAADVRGPLGGTAQNTTPKKPQLAVVDVTTSSQNIDLESATYFGGTHYQGRFVELDCDVVAYWFSSSEASNTVTETAKGATTKAQQCHRITADLPRSYKLAGRYLHIKGASAGTLRIAITEACEA